MRECLAFAMHRQFFVRMGIGDDHEFEGQTRAAPLAFILALVNPRDRGHEYPGVSGSMNIAYRASRLWIHGIVVRRKNMGLCSAFVGRLTN